jgi:CheY-like chemotaxis protein
VITPVIAEARPALQTPRFDVLVVDDDATNRRVAGLLLKRLGCACDEADSGVAALAAIARRRYDIVVTDLGMPGMSGIETTCRIRDGSRGPAPWIIGVSGYATDADRRVALAAGMDDYLFKPVTFKQYGAALDRAAVHVSRPLWSSLAHQ